MHLQRRLKTAVTTIMITGMILVTLLWVATTVSRADTQLVNQLTETVDKLRLDTFHCADSYSKVSAERDAMRVMLFDSNIRVLIMGLVGLLGGLMAGYLIGRRNGLMLAKYSPSKINHCD